MKRMAMAGVGWTLALATGLWAASQTLTVKDIVELKRLGFSEAEIRAEVAQSQSRFQLTADDVRTLKEAGLSDDLIAFLKQSAPRKKITAAAVVQWVQEGKPAEAILEEIAGGERPAPLTAADALQLSRQNVPLAVVLALRARPLSDDDLKRLAAQGLSPAGFQKLVALVGLAGRELSAAEALALVRAGVPADVVAQFRKGPSPAAPGGAAEQAARVPTPAAGDVQEYRHIGGRFVMRLPKAWEVVRTIDKGDLHYGFTPERGKTEVKAIDVGVLLTLAPVEPGSIIWETDAASTFQRMLPLIRQGEPDMEPAGAMTTAKLGPLEAAAMTFHGKLKDKPSSGVYTCELFLAVADHIVYAVSTVAPRERYAEWRESFHRIIRESDFGRRRPSQRGTPVEANQLVEQYKESVVSIVSHYGDGNGPTGTGFIIHKAGYVATNHHVVWDADKAKPFTHFSVQWDESLHRPTATATLVGCKQQPSRLMFHGGVDIALLKLTPGQYTPVKLTPLEDVKLGDPVITMGFPKRSVFATLSVFITAGVVTRFNRDVDGHLESILTDAKITHGNSGGPCISRVTGGVIGLNTYGMDIQTNQQLQTLNDLVGYYGVCPIDTVLTEFPAEAALGLDPESLHDLYDCFDLSRLFFGRWSFQAARRLADKAVKLAPQSADTHWLKGLSMLFTAEDKEGLDAALKELETALQHDPQHLNSLLTLAHFYQRSDMLLKATHYADRAIKADPNNWQPSQVRAQIYYDLKRYDEADADIVKAKELSRSVLPEPFILAGKVRYAQGQLAEGKAEYATAVRIHPANIEARLGVAEFYELQKNPRAALVEYGRILEDFRKNPEVLRRMGACYKEMQQYDEAWQQYGAALRRCREVGLRPSEALYFEMGDLAANVKRDPKLAVPLYADYLLHYGSGPNAYKGHLILGQLFVDHKLSAGVAGGHFRRAKALRPNDPEVAQKAGRDPLAPMSLEDIQLMLKLEYHPAVAADVVKVTPLTFAVRSREDLQNLLKQNIPDLVIVAILESNKNVGVATPAPQPPAGGEVQRPDAGQAPAGPVARIVGVWVTVVRAQDGGQMQIAIQFQPDGRYVLAAAQGQQKATTRGTYQVDAQTITGRNDDTGQSFAYRYQLQGNTLLMEMPEMGGPVQFQRYQGQGQGQGGP